MPKRDPVVRPWSEAENEEFRRFSEGVDNPSWTPELATFLAPGPDGEFFDLVYEADGRTQRVCGWLLGRLRKLPAQLLRE